MLLRRRRAVVGEWELEEGDGVLSVPSLTSFGRLVLLALEKAYCETFELEEEGEFEGEATGSGGEVAALKDDEWRLGVTGGVGCGVDNGVKVASVLKRDLRPK